MQTLKYVTESEAVVSNRLISRVSLAAAKSNVLIGAPDGLYDRDGFDFSPFKLVRRYFDVYQAALSHSFITIKSPLWRFFVGIRQVLATNRKPL